MKVVCIKKPSVSNNGKQYPSPEVGDTDIVTDYTKRDYGLFFFLERFGNEVSYLSDCFIPLPDTPAEVIEETQLQTA